MRRARLAALLLLVAMVAALLPVAPAAAAPPVAPACDPVRTPPELAGQVPTAEDVLGFPLGERDVTVAESDAYLQAVAAASPRVTAGTAAVSWQGRPLRYAIVGKPGNVTPAGLARIRLQTALLHDPRTPAKLAEHLARTTPAILWVAGNVHGGEESGTDGALRVMYELADRRDCAATQILDNAIVVLLPTQNPDGREADTRRNAYGFDLNRDWFARTQPETDGKLELLRRYPPVLFIDAHEMGRESFFFPPNADPIYHEITDESVDWINNLYGPAMADEFTRQGIPFFNRDVYDLFYMGYGDTVPSTGFTAAGMTYEKASGDPTPRRVYEQYLTQWVSLSWGAANADDILARWHGAWVEALRQGQAGELEPNEIVNPGNELVTQVPDRPLRHWFLRADDPAKATRAARPGPAPAADGRQGLPALQAAHGPRLQGLRPRPAGGPAARRDLLGADGPGPEALGPGDAQRGHLHPVPVLLRRDRLEQPAAVQPARRQLRGGARPGRGPGAPAGRPRAAAAPGRPADSRPVPARRGQLGHRVRRLAALPARQRLAAALPGAGRRRHRRRRPEGHRRPAGPQRLRDRRRRRPRPGRPAGAGRLGGRRAAATSAGRAAPAWPRPSASPPPPWPSRPPTSPAACCASGSTAESPLSKDVGPFAWAFYAYDLVMRASDPAQVAVAYPPAASPDFFVSGFAAGEEELGGTAAVIDEPVGDGRAVLFSFEPNFRAFTDGTQRLLRNAVFGPAPEAAAPTRAEAAARAGQVATARAAAGRLSTLDRPIRVTVAAAGAAETERLLRGYGARFETRRAGGQVHFLVANPRGLAADEHPFATDLARRLRDRGVPVRAFSMR